MPITRRWARTHPVDARAGPAQIAAAVAYARNPFVSAPGPVHRLRTPAERQGRAMTLAALPHAASPASITRR